MVIREDVVTRAAPERCWELIADPSLHDLWNSHIVATERTEDGPVRVGSRYRVTYELSGRRSEMDAEVTACSPSDGFEARLEERNQGDGRDWRRFFVERYELTRRGERTRVLHEVRIHHSGVNPLLRFVMWLVMKTGKPTGQPFLERFRELAEDPELTGKSKTA